MSQVREAIVITPVKDSINTTTETIATIRKNYPDIPYIVYNDFSSEETMHILERLAQELNFSLVNLADVTDKPSPNYDLVLQDAQKRAVQDGKHLIIVESDVTIRPDTLQKMVAYTNQQADTGLVAAITVDEAGEVNYPYQKFSGVNQEIIKTKRSLSFCCTLISHDFLKQYSFQNLDQSKDWYDTTISYQSNDLGFNNVVLKQVTVIHHPHASRPWKQLKYKNPIKYYFNKWIKGRDKI